MKILLFYLSILLTSISYAQNVSKDLNEIKSVIIKETQTEGKLDFFTPIKGKEYDGYQIKPGLVATYREMTLYNWAKSVKRFRN